MFEQTRSAGVEARAEVGETGGIPPVVSREAYRILQEALTDVLRHAGKVPVDVRLGVRAERLELEVTNPVATAAYARSGGGSDCAASASASPSWAGGSPPVPTARGGGCASRSRLVPLARAAATMTDILIADDEPLVRTGLRAMIDAEPHLTGRRGRRRAQAVRMARQLRPDSS